MVYCRLHRRLSKGENTTERKRPTPIAIPIVSKRPPQLQVRKTISRTWKLTFCHQRTFWRFLLPPVVVITVVSYAAFYYVMFVLGLEASHTPILVTGFLAGIPMAMVTFRMATMWHRWVLLVALPEGIADSFKFGKREILFLLVFVIFGLLFGGLSDLFATHIAPLLAGSSPESTLDSVSIDRRSNLPGMATMLVKGVLFFTFSRFLILLPAIAIDKAMSVKDAWKIT